MLQFLIGLSLSLYSAFVLKTLTDWRADVLKFVKNILDSGKNLLEEGQGLLDPVKDTANSTRKSAEKIEVIAGRLKSDLPPKLKSVSQNIKDANEALVRLQPQITAALQELPASVVGILNEAIDFLEGRSPDLKSLSEDIKQVRLAIDDPNAANDKDIVAIISKIAEKLHKDGDSNSLSETLKDTGAKLDKAAESLGALAFVIVGNSAPLTLAVLTTLSAVSIIKDIVDALRIKKGALLSISLRFPTSDIGVKIPIPGPDIDITLISAGEVIDRGIQVPEKDISIFPVPSKLNDFLNKVSNAKQQANQALDAPEIAEDVKDAFNAIGQGLKNTGKIVENASTTLLETNEAIGKFTPVLDSVSEKLTKFSEEFLNTATKLKPFGATIVNRSGELQNSIDANFPALTNSLNNIITEIETLDITTPLGALEDTADEIQKIANLIDDGTDLDSPNKEDFRQRINDILKILASVVRTGEDFDKLFKPLYLIVVALHALLLITGLVLILRSDIFGGKAPNPPEPIPSNPPSPVEPPDDLRSDRGIDYTQLRDLLKGKKWEEANQLTSALILELANQRQQGYLVDKDTRSLSCQDLRTINQLWMRYGDGHFGLSVQASLWESIGGQTSYDTSNSEVGYQLSKRFESLVGWDNSQTSSAIQPGVVSDGYLPFRPSADGGSRDSWGGWWISAISGRLKSCEIK